MSRQLILLAVRVLVSCIRYGRATPLGFDPAPIYEHMDHPDFAVLKLIPWRIDLIDPPTQHLVWRGSQEASQQMKGKD